MKKIPFFLCLFFNISLFSQDINDCEFYLKYPPVLESFLVTEERKENIRLFVKEEFGRYNIELKLRIYNPNGYTFDDFYYVMYDDGSHGDLISGDFIYANDNILISYFETETFLLSTVMIFVNYLEDSNVVHTDEVWMNFCHISKEYLSTLEIPVINYMDSNSNIIWSDNFISVNKIENWHELDKQQHGYGCYFDFNYLRSESILFEYWNESQISDNTDDFTYLQVDLIEPAGQFTYTDGDAIYLGLGGLFGPLVHELLHRWVPAINNNLGLLDSDSHNGHHPNIFRNTSGFLYQTWSRINGIFCEDYISEIHIEDDTLKYLLIEFGNDFYVCERSVDQRKTNQQFNDYELYLMGLLPIDSVSLPLFFLENMYQWEQIIDTVTGLSIGDKFYFKEIVEIDKEQLENARNSLLTDNAWRSNFSGDTIKLIPVYNWTSTPSMDELKALNLFSEDIARKGKSQIDEGGFFLTYFEATQGRGMITTKTPVPSEPVVSTIVHENVVICQGETYKDWSIEGTYTENLSSVQGGDSVIITNLTVNQNPPIPNIIQLGDSLVSNASYGNQWYLNGNELAGATGQNYFLIEAGEYHVVVTNSSGCVSAASNNIDVSLSSSVESGNTRLYIFPNPSKDLITIQFNLLGTYNFQIVSVNGDVIRNSSFIGTSQQIDLSSFQKGVYFITIRSNDLVTTRKIIKL